MKRIPLVSLVSLLNLSAATAASDIWVDNVRGNDSAEGTQAAPMKTLAAAAKLMQTGCTMHLVSNSVPYHEAFNVHDSTSSMRGTVIDGHGAIFDGREVPALAEWTDCGGGVWSIKCPNNAWVMDRQGYWSGHAIVFKDGVALPWKASRDALVDDSYYLKKIFNADVNDAKGVHNTLYVKLPSGQDPETAKIAFPRLNYAINVECVSDITVRNVTGMYFYGDAFDSAFGTNDRFENVRGTKCMDQGISAHGSEVTVVDSLFDGNAGCGVVDVHAGEKRARTTYIGCTFADDSFRGGVEIQRGDYCFTNCVFRNNAAGYQSTFKAGNHANFRISDCTFDAGSRNCSQAIYISDIATGIVERCTFKGYTADPPYIAFDGCKLTVTP